MLSFGFWKVLQVFAKLLGNYHKSGKSKHKMEGGFFGEHTNIQSLITLTKYQKKKIGLKIKLLIIENINPKIRALFLPSWCDSLVPPYLTPAERVLINWFQIFVKEEFFAIIENQLINK
jgi:hypothetical protein